MSRHSRSSNSIVQIFTTLCLSHVKELLTENLVHFNKSSTSFICDGQLFSIADNRSFIVDESLTEYGIKLNFSHSFN